MKRTLAAKLERLAEEGYITIDSPPQPGKLTDPQPGQRMGPEGKAKFEITDKALDFLDDKNGFSKASPNAAAPTFFGMALQIFTCQLTKAATSAFESARVNGRSAG